MSYQSQGSRDLQTYLRENKFTDLDSAKTWLMDWYYSDQEFTEGKYKGEFLSMRAMCGHISLALNPEDDKVIQSSFDTLYGTELNEYWQNSLV